MVKYVDFDFDFICGCCCYFPISSSVPFETHTFCCALNSGKNTHSLKLKSGYSMVLGGYSVSKKSIEQHEMLNLKRKKSSKLYRNQVFIVIVEGQHIFCKNRNCIVGMWKHLGVIITHMQSFMTWVSIPRFDLIVKWCNNCTQHWTLQFLS